MSRRDKIIQDFIRDLGEDIKESADKQAKNPFIDKIWAEEEWDECLYRINEDGLMVRMSLEESNAIKKKHKQKQDEDCDIDDYSLLDPSNPIYDDPELEEKYKHYPGYKAKPDGTIDTSNPIFRTKEDEIYYKKYTDYLNMDIPFTKLLEPTNFSSDKKIAEYNKRKSIEFRDLLKECFI